MLGIFNSQGTDKVKMIKLYLSSLFLATDQKTKVRQENFTCPRSAQGKRDVCR